MSSQYTSNPEIPYGYCHCGCGQKTNIFKRTNSSRGDVSGQPARYIRGHSKRYTLEQRISAFWKNINKDGSVPVHCPELGNCWEWELALYKTGYGQMNWDGITIMTHRISWFLINGEIPDGLWVLHKCDNRKCVRPDHLFLGTVQDNIDDMVAKGRNATSRQNGEQNPNCKLTDKQIAEIRKRYECGNITQARLAVEYEISKSQICNIVNYLRRVEES